MTYILLNPHVPGKELSSKQSTVNSAAEEIWSKLSGNIKHYVPEFYFTVKDTTKDKLYHFNVKESMENDKVKYSLKQYKGKVDEQYLANEVDNEQKGAGRFDDSSSSSSSSDDDYLYFPTNKKYYNNGLTLTYYPTIYGVPNLLLPTFTTTFAPFVRVSFPSTYFGSTVVTNSSGMHIYP